MCLTDKSRPPPHTAVAGGVGGGLLFRKLCGNYFLLRFLPTISRTSAPPLIARIAISSVSGNASAVCGIYAIGAGVAVATGSGVAVGAGVAEGFGLGVAAGVGVGVGVAFGV